MNFPPNYGLYSVLSPSPLRASNPPTNCLILGRTIVELSSVQLDGSMQWVPLGPPESDQFVASNFEEMQPLTQVSQQPQPVRSSPRSKQRGIVKAIK